MESQIQNQKCMILTLWKYEERKRGTNTQITASVYEQWDLRQLTLSVFICLQIVLKNQNKTKLSFLIKEGGKEEEGKEGRRGREKYYSSGCLMPQVTLPGTAVPARVVCWFPLGAEPRGWLCSGPTLALTADHLPLRWTHTSLSLSVPLDFHSPLWLVAMESSWHPPC